MASRAPAPACQDAMAIVLFGLTGGVASGKSAIARHWRSGGLAVIDADRLAREVVEPSTAGFEQVVARFGARVVGHDGTLDRAALGSIVFADAEARRALEGIVHPLIRARTAERCAELEQRGELLACYEAALLVENGLADTFRPLVVVSAPRQVQLARLRERDGLSDEDAERRLAAQLALEDKVLVADFVIDNTGALEEALAAADAVLEQVRAGILSGTWPPAGARASRAEQREGR